MKENLNTVLLALILLGVGINTYVLFNNSDSVTETAHVHGPNDGHNHDVAGITSSDPMNPAAMSASAQNPQPAAPAGPATSINFEKSTHDFGVIKQNTKNTYAFKFTNSGNEPLIIQNAQGACGCTVPEYPKEPIPPGGTGEILVEYSPGTQKGMQNKTVTITANTNPTQTQLNITANVEEVK